MKFLLSCLFLLAATAAMPADFTPRSLAYVLQADRLAPERSKAVKMLAESGRDLIVIDAAYAEGSPWTALEIESIRAGKKGRRVLAYLSIGEAEDYRPYWQKSWDADGDGRPDAAAPSFLHSENPDWEGNYRVRYWQPEWQAIMLPAVESIMMQGFDGLYLDIVDAFEFYEYDEAAKDWLDDRQNPETGHSYRQDMAAWVGRIAQQARARHSEALIIPQNASQLLANAEYRALISGIGVEDLLVAGKKLRTEKQRSFVRGFLDTLKAEAKPVLVIDYPKGDALHGEAFSLAAKLGYTLLLTDRELTTLGESR